MPKTPQNYKEFPLAFVQESIALATSGFGLVVALAWNELVKDLIAHYIAPYLGASSGTISKLIYALAMTFLAIFVTMQLVRVEQTLQRIVDRRQKAAIKPATRISKSKAAKKRRPS
jgi:hypothetical protein